MKRSRSPKLGESGRITGTEDRSEHGPRTSFERLNALGEAIGAPYHADKHFALPPPDKRGAQTISGHRRGSRPPPAPLFGIQGTAGPPRWPSPPAPAGPLESNPSAPPARPRLYPAVVPSDAKPVGNTFQARIHRVAIARVVMASGPGRTVAGTLPPAGPTPSRSRGARSNASSTLTPTRLNPPVTKPCTNPVASQFRSNRGLTGQCAGAKVGSMLRQVRQVGLLVVVVRGDAAVGSCRT